MDILLKTWNSPKVGPPPASDYFLGCQHPGQLTETLRKPSTVEHYVFTRKGMVEVSCRFFFWTKNDRLFSAFQSKSPSVPAASWGGANLFTLCSQPNRWIVSMASFLTSVCIFCGYEPGCHSYPYGVLFPHNLARLLPEFYIHKADVSGHG